MIHLFLFEEQMNLHNDVKVFFVKVLKRALLIRATL